MSLENIEYWSARVQRDGELPVYLALIPRVEGYQVSAISSDDQFPHASCSDCVGYCFPVGQEGIMYWRAGDKLHFRTRDRGMADDGSYTLLSVTYRGEDDDD